MLRKQWGPLAKASGDILLDVASEYEIRAGEMDQYIKGATKQITVNAYELSYEARRKCLEYHGSQCSVCGFDAGKIYGPEFKGQIHVHHTKPWGEIKEGYVMDPVKDLVPVCPNCHMIVHSILRGRD